MRISDWSSDVCSSDLQRHIGQADAGVDREIIDALFGLLDEGVAEDFPRPVFRDAADFLECLIDRDGADRHRAVADDPFAGVVDVAAGGRSEEHTSEIQSLMRNSSAVFCLYKKNIRLCTH